MQDYRRLEDEIRFQEYQRDQLRYRLKKGLKGHGKGKKGKKGKKYSGVDIDDMFATYGGAASASVLGAMALAPMMATYGKRKRRDLTEIENQFEIEDLDYVIDAILSDKYKSYEGSYQKPQASSKSRVHYSSNGDNVLLATSQGIKGINVS